MPPAIPSWGIDHHLVAVEPGRLVIAAPLFAKSIGAILSDGLCPAISSFAICLLPVVVERGGGTDMGVGSNRLEFHGEDSTVSLRLESVYLFKLAVRVVVTLWLCKLATTFSAVHFSAYVISAVTIGWCPMTLQLSIGPETGSKAD